MKKQNLPSKICPICKRPFIWRKKWRLNWEKVKYCSKKNVILAIDEVYYPFGGPTAIDLIGEYENLFIMRSLSKAFGLASIRIGYLLGSKGNIDYVSKTRSGYETNSISMEIAIFFIENYFEGETEPVLSRLGSEPALRTHLLSLITSGTISTRESLHSFLEKTLFGAQGELWRTQHRLNKVLDFLDNEKLIEIEGKNDGEFVSANDALDEKLKPTAFGRKVSQLYIDPLSGVIIKNALESDVEANPLGLLHTIARTPDIYSLYVRKNEMETYLTHLMFFLV